MTQVVQVRAATAADVAAMHQIRLAVRENELGERTRITERDYLSFVNAGSAWAAETSDGIAGFAALDAASRNVWALFVAPDRERVGVGRALHDHMLIWASAQGLRTLWLTTSPGTRAESFYRRCGWVEAGPTESGELRFERKL